MSAYSLTGAFPESGASGPLASYNRSQASGLRHLASRAFLVIGRAAAFLFFSLCALCENAIAIAFVRKEFRAAARARWLHRWSRFACKVLGVHVAVSGKLQRRGLWVSNHLSYLDIIIFSAAAPCLFVSKSEVAHWPLFGRLAKSAGTIFVNRKRMLASTHSAEAVRGALENGALVVLFAEGTSSDGATVLPFKPALFEPAVELGCEITVGAIGYSLAEGSVADEICYWRDMTLLPHLLNLFSKGRIDAHLRFAPTRTTASDRKTLARELHAEVVRLRA